MIAGTGEYHALAEALAAADVEERLVPRLAAYGALVLRRNRTHNLTAARDPLSLAGHILDALSLLQHVRSPLIDVGAGGGLPGLVLALASGAEVTLLDATGKKTAFLKEAVRELGLRAQVVTGRAEALGRDPALREQFACATARAVASAPAVIELTLPFLAVGGVALLQRGDWAPGERNAACDAAPMLGGSVSGEIALGERRRIVLVSKSTPTPARFPRRTGVPTKRPLCWD